MPVDSGLSDIARDANQTTIALHLTTEELDRLTAATSGSAAAGASFAGAWHGVSSTLERFEQVGGAAGETIGGLGRAMGSLSRGDLVGMTMNLSHVASGLAEMSTEAERSERAIQLLGPALESVSAATADTVDETDALRLQQRLLEAGLHTSGEELGSIAGFARNYARSMGIDANEATERLTSALIRGSAGGLRPFGLQVDHNATRAANWHNVLGQLGARVAETGVTARTAAEELARSERELGDATNRLGRSIAEMIHLRQILNGLTHFITGAGYDERAEAANASQRQQQLTDDTRKYGDAVATVATRFGDLHAELPAFNALSREAVRNLTSDLAHAENAEQARTTILNANRLASTERQTAALHAQNDAAEAARRTAANDREANELSTGGGGGASHADDPERIRKTIVELEALRQRLNTAGIELAHVDRTHGEATQHYLDRVKHLREEALAAQHVIDEQLAHQMRAAAEVAQAGNQWVDQQLERIRTAQDAADASDLAHQTSVQNRIYAIHQLGDAHAQMARAWAIDSVQMSTATSAAADASKMAYDSLSSAIVSHVRALADGRESAAEAGRGILKDSLMNLGTEALAKALFYTAEGIARAASSYGLDATAVGLFESAAIMGGVAALGLGGGALVGMTAPKAAAAGGPPAAPRTASAPGGAASDNHGSQTLVFNQYGIFDGKGARGMVSDTLDDLSRRGIQPVAVRRTGSGR